MQNLKTFLLITFTFLIVIFHIYIGHFYAPSGIDLLPITMLLITVIIFYFAKTNILYQCFFLVILFLTLDIGLKLYAGGTHDFEGLGFMNIYYFFGLIPSLCIVFYKIYKNSEINLKTKIILSISILNFLYFQNYLFWNLGLGKHYPV